MGSYIIVGPRFLVNNSVGALRCLMVLLGSRLGVVPVGNPNLESLCLMSLLPVRL